MEMSTEEHDERFDANIDIIVRQTTYTREVAAELLKKHGSLEEVIKDYLGIQKKVETSVSTNQGIFKTIRKFL
jgi:hypothetical protein